MFGGFEQLPHAKVSSRSKETLSFAKVETRQRSESAMVTLAQTAKKFKRTFGWKDLTSVKSPRTVPLGAYGVKAAGRLADVAVAKAVKKTNDSLCGLTCNR